MPFRVGFICGKDTDVVEDPKYTALGGDASFLADLPDRWRVDPESHEWLCDCDPGTKGFAHCDVAVAWWIHKHCPDLQVDIMESREITTKRLQANDVNFLMGYNACSAYVENNEHSTRNIKALEECGNTVPTLEQENFILYKSRYMKACMEAGVPMAPTIFSMKGKRSPKGLLNEIKDRGWKTFVLKLSESGFSLGFMKLTVEECEQDPRILKTYFKDNQQCTEFIVQEAIEGFTRNWETRCFWYNGQFLYAIANMAAVSTEDGAERIVTGSDIPAEFLENAKRIGQEAIKCLPPTRCPTGGEIPNIIVRTDIGCSDSQIHDKDYNWDPNGKTFFLNEIEPSSTTYFVRHLKFDCLPMYGRLFAESARKVANQIMLHPKRKTSKVKASLTNKKASGIKKSDGRHANGKKTKGKKQVSKPMKAAKKGLKVSMKAMKSVSMKATKK